MQSRWEEFDLRLRPGMNVIIALRDIAEKPVGRFGNATTPVAYESNCLFENLKRVMEIHDSGPGRGNRGDGHFERRPEVGIEALDKITRQFERGARHGSKKPDAGDLRVF